MPDKQEGSVHVDVHASGKSQVGDVIGRVIGDVVKGNKITFVISGSVVLGFAVLGFLIFIIANRGIPILLPSTATPAPTPLPFPAARPGEQLIILAPYTGQLHDAATFPERYVRDRLQARADQMNASGFHLRIESYPNDITSAREARQLGGLFGALLVVWGEFDDIGGVRTNIEIMQNMPSSMNEMVGDWLSLVPLNPDQESFSIHRRDCLLQGSPRQADYLVMVALGLMARIDNHIPEAEAFFRDAIDLGDLNQTCPTNPAAAFYWHGKILSEQFQNRAALADFDAAIQRGLTTAAVYTARGNARFILGEIPGAIADLQTAKNELTPGDLQGQAIVMSNLGRAQAFQGDLSGAEERYRQALQLDQKSGDLEGQATDWIWLGNLVLQRSGAQEAGKCYQIALDLYNQASSSNGQAVALTNIGMAKELLGDFSNAAKAYEDAGKLFQENGSRSGSAINLLHKGSLAHQQNQLDEAMGYYNQAYATCSDLGYSVCQSVSLGNIGLIQLAKQDKIAALASFQEALRMDEVIEYPYGQAKQWMNIALVQSAAADWDGADSSYQAALEIYQAIGSVEGQARAWLGLGVIAIKRGDEQAALDPLRNAARQFTLLGMPEATGVNETIQKIQQK